VVSIGQPLARAADTRQTPSRQEETMRTRQLALGGLAALLATAAVADPAPASLPSDLKNPAGAVYMAVPKGEPVRFYPDKAALQRVSGEVRLRCLIGPAGEMKRCTILSEDPPGYDFAQSAAIMSAYFHARPTAPDGERTAGHTVVIPIHFAPPPTPPANPASPPAPPPP
jgi:TonB family protein